MSDLDVARRAGLYTVDSRFIDDARREAWLGWYASHINGMLTKVPGFVRAQRFRQVGTTDSFLGIYALRAFSVLDSPEYLGIMKGGRFPREWEDSIRDWNRGFYVGISEFPEVGPSETLLVTDEKLVAVKDLQLPFRWVTAAGLNTRSPQRGFTILDRTEGLRPERMSSPRLRVFEPITPRLSAQIAG